MFPKCSKCSTSLAPNENFVKSKDFKNIFEWFPENFLMLPFSLKLNGNSKNIPLLEQKRIFT